ncbi:MAG: regulatory protein GemA [Burkholderiales bacterium]|nr:regulatory protein GemA [Burkholderiales bacterium]
MRQAHPRRRGANGKAERSNELAKIHIAKAQLGLDDDTYRAMLWTVARVRSAKDLDAGGREAVLLHLRGCGWKDTAPAGGTPYRKGTPAALIRWLWTQLHRAGGVDDASDRALRRYIAAHAPGRTGADEVAPQHLDRADTSAIIEQLKGWLARVEKEQARP